MSSISSLEDSEGEISSKGGDDKNDFFDAHLETNYSKVQEFINKTTYNTTQFIDHGSVWTIKNGLDIAKIQVHLKPKLKPFVNYLNHAIEKPLVSGCDILYTKETWDNINEFPNVLTVHFLNRVLLTRDKILENNNLKEKNDDAKENEYRDQGFTRPRVLIILPFKNSAIRYVGELIRIFESLFGQVENKNRFYKEYGMDKEESEQQKQSFERKPEDYKKTFEGNGDDCFRLGIKVTRKSLKLFSDFYQSDIILASPLALKLCIEGEVTFSGKNKKLKKKEDWDFLSSIETLIIDQAHILLMQNWDHLTFVVNLMNQIPKDPSKTDFSRVKTAYLEGNASYLRQNIFLSEFPFPELMNLSNGAKNLFGKVEFHNTMYKSLIRNFEQEGVRIQLHPIKLNEDLSNEPEIRLAYFVKNIFPKLQKYHHACIFIPSYFDYLQVCKFLKNQEELASYVAISEYSTHSETTKARAQFFNGNVRFLVTTERFYFYKRLRIRGIKKLFYYSLPEHVDYFGEWIGMLKDNCEKSMDGSKVRKNKKQRYEVPVLVSQLDYYRLERLVGTKKIKEIFN